MKKEVQILSLGEAIKNIETWCDEQRRSAIETRDQAIADEIRARQVLADLDAAGVPVQTSRWLSARHEIIELGIFARTKVANAKLATLLRAARRALGVSLGKPSTSLGSEKDRTVAYIYRPQGVGGVGIRFDRRIRAGKVGKCRLVRNTSVSLVCDV